MTNANIAKMQSKMRRWSDRKLDMELAFASSAQDPAHQETLDWLAACRLEQQRRASAAS